ncbi:MAG: bacillithiol biosynthesis cysteine-adding enzyme BshC, partial [Myxococcota bacterium]|nr:bacillithiol biosynthesis cysteine-adding enzyme BshC [Myxococcota bacterium]
MIDGLEEIIGTARRRGVIAPPVLSVLAAQNARWGPSARRQAHLDALGRGAVVVVTGQQLGLFLGPLYTIYKAASAVRLAKALEAEGVAAVPVFWLQSEDHDWDEIRTTRWLGADGPREASLPQRPPSRARSSIAHERVGEGIEPVLEALGRDLREDEEGAAFFAQLSAHYRPDATLADAFGGLLASLFEPYGLLTFSPRDAALAPLAAPIHRRAIEDHEQLAAASIERAAQLEAAGKRAPIPIRADCALSFFHPSGPEGGRYRLMPGGATFGLSGAPESFDRAEVFRRLEEAPLELSTSALLRPVLQDHLLPTAAYVGGPTEVAYAAQLAPIYARFEIAMAPFVRRASFVVTSPRDRDALDALGLTLDDLGADETTLVQRLGRGPISDELEQLAASVRTGLEGMRGALEQLDPGLGKTATKSEATIEHALGKLQARAERAAAARHPERLETLRRTLAALRPGGAPQERVYGLAAVATRG